MKDYERKFWEDFCKVHKKLKEFYIRSEEHSKDFSTILQPIKEQKDALEHIVRVYCELLDGNEDEKYIAENFSKAKGHIYRAYYDTADIFTIILRERISSHLSVFSHNQISSVWGKEKYETERNFLIDVNESIAKLRIEKDVIDKSDVFNRYTEIIERLFNIYIDITKNIYPSLAAKYL